jgi:hypothetical protein
MTNEFACFNNSADFMVRRVKIERIRKEFPCTVDVIGETETDQYQSPERSERIQKSADVDQARSKTVLYNLPLNFALCQPTFP